MNVACVPLLALTPSWNWNWSPNQPATSIGLEFQELGVTVGSGVGGEAGSAGRAAFHVICIETEKLAADKAAQTFLFGFYQTLMKGQPVQYAVDRGKEMLLYSQEVWSIYPYMDIWSIYPCMEGRRCSSTPMRWYMSIYRHIEMLLYSHEVGYVHI
jgi:hypothetical protein